MAVKTHKIGHIFFLIILNGSPTKKARAQLNEI